MGAGDHPRWCRGAPERWVGVMAGPYPSDGDITVRRGEVWWVDFDTVDGGEIRKMRPAVVVTADALNRARRTVVVVPLATGPQARPPIVVATPSAGDGRV